MKLCYVNIMPEDASKSFLKFVEMVFKKVLRPDTEIQIRAPKDGIRRVTDLTSSNYLYFVSKIQIAETIIGAAKENFDAIVIGDFEDPAVREVREIVNVPIIGIGEATVHMACQMGHKFAVLSLNDPKVITREELLLDLWMVRGKAIARPVRAITLSDIEIFKHAFDNPDILISDIQTHARECAEDGAEVVVIGCGALGPILTACGCSKIEGTEIPLLDPLAAGLKTAEMFVDMHKSLGIPYLSRKEVYARPRDKDIQRVRSQFGWPT